jgi:hypothetical protein
MVLSYHGGFIIAHMFRSCEPIGLGAWFIKVILQFFPLVSVTNLSLYVSAMPHLLIISLSIFPLAVTAQTMIDDIFINLQNHSLFHPTDIGYGLYTADSTAHRRIASDSDWEPVNSACPTRSRVATIKITDPRNRSAFALTSHRDAAAAAVHFKRFCK